ncbi:MAG: hypothetical protein IJ435_09445 [Clostridia bacterium]|nr:hypothetical protein [Clostridia bacterium]
MFKKLLKHELLQSWKIYVPIIVLYACVSIAMVLTANYFTEKWHLSTNTSFMETANNISVINLFLSVAVRTAVYILIAVGFYKTTIGKMGYITHTLPATVNEILTVKVAVYSFYLLLLTIVRKIGTWISFSAMGDITYNYRTTLVSELKDVAVCIFVVLSIYAALSIGFSFERFKMGIAAGVYLLIHFAGEYGSEIVRFVLWNVMGDKLLGNQVMSVFSMVMTFLCIPLWFFITKYFLEKRLNLE